MQYKEYDYDLLLEYLSRKESESYFNFKKYVLNLNYELIQDEPDYEAVENGMFNLNNNTKFHEKQLSFIRKTRNMLSRLAHCEFYFQNNKNKFAVTPPVICMLDNTYRGVLCGKRTSDITEELKHICEKSDCVYTEYENINAPKAIFIDFQNQKKQEKFNGLLYGTKYINDLKIQENFSETILTNLPTVEHLTEEAEQGNLQEYEDFHEETSADREIFNINADTRFVEYRTCYDTDWSVIKDNKHGYNQSYYLKCNQKYYYIDKYYGILLNLYNSKRIPLLSWKDNNLIKKKSWLQFPELIERALSLQSGYNIEINQKGEVVYKNINQNIANLLSEVIGLEVTYEK